MGKILLIDITFHANTEYADTDALIKAQLSSLNYMHEIKDKLDIEVIKHIDNKKTIIKEHSGFRFFEGRNGFFSIPSKSFLYLKKQKPDIILVQGLKFPFQIIMLKWFLGKKVKLIAKHHADQPPKWHKRIFFRIADIYTDCYLFTSYGNAKEWIDAKLINSNQKIVELPATYTSFSKLDKSICKQKLKMGEGLHYLWVGRLNANKDPITILNAFEKYSIENSRAQLHLIYQSDDLLSEIKQFIQNHPIVTNKVLLHGYIPYDQLPEWYSAADFFVSGSHREAGSAGLLEAMACGCIPIVTAIPSAMKVICDGTYGYHFEPGDADALLNVFISSSKNDRQELSTKVETYFQNEYSLSAVTDKLFQLCLWLTDK